jgi:hypothetical protein
MEEVLEYTQVLSITSEFLHYGKGMLLVDR